MPENKPYGYIYIATNQKNGKVYIGQTTTSRWKEGQNPVKERWKEEVGESYRRERKGGYLRYIENAIIKHGSESFDIQQKDIAYSRKELDEKESFWVKEYDATNPDKGYNLTEGGEGGKLSEKAKENVSKAITKKYQENEYYNKQTKERQERAKNPEWREKMTKINREITNKPEYKEKMSRIIKEKAKDPKYIENVSKGVSRKYQEKEYHDKQTTERKERGKDPKWRGKMTKINQERSKNPEWREKMREINKKYRKEIPDLRDFLKDVQEMRKKDIGAKYRMGKKTVNNRIQEILGGRGVKNYTEAKNYLEGKDVDKFAELIQKENREKSKEIFIKSEGKGIEKERMKGPNREKEENNEQKSQESQVSFNQE